MVCFFSSYSKQIQSLTSYIFGHTLITMLWTRRCNFFLILWLFFEPYSGQVDTILEICGAINVPLFLGCALHHINIQLDSGTLSLCALLTSLPSYDFLAYDRINFQSWDTSYRRTQEVQKSACLLSCLLVTKDKSVIYSI